MSTLSLLDALAANPSKLFKEEFIAQNADNEVLKRAFYLAYQPTLNFFTKKIPVFFPQPEPTMSLDDALTAAETFLAKRVHTGKAASDYLQFLLFSLSADDAEVLSRVILRDLKIGCAGNTANKVWKNLILDVPYMRCSLIADTNLKSFPWSDGLFSQLKSDGSFANVNHFESGEVGIMTRNGTTYPEGEFGAVIDAIKNTDSRGSQFHGELLVFNQFDELMERAEGNGILNKLAKGGDLPVGHSVRFVVWDNIPLEEAVPKNKYKVPYSTRLKHLESLGLEGVVEVVETRVVHSVREAYEHYQEQLAQGLEGTILKHPDAIWTDSTSKEQVKFKLDVTIDLKVVGFNPGKGKNAATFGSIQCISADGLLTVNVSGMKDDMRKLIWEDHENWVGSIITVCSNAMTKVRKDGTRSLFLPRFVEERTDKNDADTMVQVIAQFESAVTSLEMLMTA